MNPNPHIDEDLQALAETARRFADERVKPGFLERDKTRVFERALLRERGELGFICPELPEQFGGLGMGCLAAGLIHDEIARADLSFSYLNLLASLKSQILSNCDNPEIVDHWLKRIVQGEGICAISLTESRSGLDAANPGLKIDRDGDFYFINDEKTSISTENQADTTVVFARHTRFVHQGDQRAGYRWLRKGFGRGPCAHETLWRPYRARHAERQPDLSRTGQAPASARCFVPVATAGVSNSGVARRSGHRYRNGVKSGPDSSPGRAVHCVPRQ
jgi:alkylation response protein AidB-like acyl-CoA dehydrogenase